MKHNIVFSLGPNLSTKQTFLLITIIKTISFSRTFPNIHDSLSNSNETLLNVTGAPLGLIQDDLTFCG